MLKSQLLQYRLAVASIICFIFMQLFAGILRWFFDLIHLAFLAYLPNLMMLITLAHYFYTQECSELTQRLRLLAITIFLFAAIVGYFNTQSLAQTIFALWVLIPFIFALVCNPLSSVPDRYLKIAVLVCFVIAAGGVVVHSVVPYPWVGVTYQIGGVELEGAREWQASGGAQRLSGFARSSFDVAGHIILMAGLSSLRIKLFILRLLLWIVCFLAVLLSTSKGIILTLLVTFFCCEGLLRGYRSILFVVFTLGLLWMFVPPLMGWTMDWQEAARVDIEHPLYGSFIDRMNDMWPKALQLATTHGLPPFGRGLGGIGVPLSIFEPELFNAGDNLFVYVFVVFGIWSLPVLFLAGVSIFRMCIEITSPFINKRDYFDTICLAVIINWYGGVSNIIENAVLALVSGVVLQQLFLNLLYNKK